MDNQAKEVVLSFVSALNQLDYKTARTCMNDQFSFAGVLGSRDGAEAYVKDMERMQLKYDIKKAFAEGNDVCLLSDLTISGQVIFCCSWYRVEAGKIISLRVVFDPRPLLNNA